MPLIIDGLPVDDNVLPAEIPYQFANLKDRSEEFLRSKLKDNRILSKSNRVLYVCQREFATVSPTCNSSNFKWIASDDATTCQIIVIIEKTTNSISLGHFDGVDTRRGLDLMLKSLLSITALKCSDPTMFNFHLYMFSGFLDKKKYSEVLYKDIIDYFKTSTCIVHLDLCCSHELNNHVVNGLNSPLVTGVAVNIKDLEFIVSSCIDRGPDIILRECRILSGGEQMKNIYDCCEGVVIIEPFFFKQPVFACQLLRLDDVRYLSLMSTSPHCEPAHFVETSKTALRYMLNNPDSMKDLFKGAAKKYKLMPNHEWDTVLS